MEHIPECTSQATEESNGAGKARMISTPRTVATGDNNDLHQAWVQVEQRVDDYRAALPPEAPEEQPDLMSNTLAEVQEDCDCDLTQEVTKAGRPAPVATSNIGLVTGTARGQNIQASNNWQIIDDMMRQLDQMNYAYNDRLAVLERLVSADLRAQLRFRVCLWFALCALTSGIAILLTVH